MNEMLRFDHVRYCYGDVCAVSDVCFDLQQKTLCALVGPNGGGKTTLVKLAAGLMQPGEGQIHRRSGLSAAYVPQVYGFDPSFPLTVRELVMMGTLPNRIRPFFRYSDIQREKAADALQRVGLSDYAGRGISQLSSGQLRRAMIARALSSDTDMILLDEPDAGLDIDASRHLYQVLDTLKKDKTILVASHQIDAVLTIADSALYVNGTVRGYPLPNVLKDQLKGGFSDD